MGMFEVTAEDYAVLLDETEKARQVATPLDYSEGYYDGLRMAIAILDGQVA